MKEHVVAIDLGTSCTAYSWKSVLDPNPCVGAPDVGISEEVTGKSPTTLLIRGTTEANKTFKPSAAEAYGRVAQRRYAENDIPHGAQLFKRFKMQLHNKPSQQNYDDLTGAWTKSVSKKAEIMLLDIFVMALEYIKEAALERITTTEAVAVENVTWVLTVPVCCSEPAKHFMRKAAVLGGFIKGGDDDEGLVLCMEPIAACLALGDRLSWQTRDKYLVIDCGGGTVDISAFQVDNAAEGGLAQVGKPTGGAWGSTYVDKQFEGYLRDFVISVAQDAGERSLDSFFASSAMYRVLQGWERAKISLRSTDEDCRIDLNELSREPLEVEMKSMDEGRRMKNRGGQELVGGDGTWDLVLRPALLGKFFKPQCDNIAQAVSEQLETPELRNLTSVVMVGGFAGSVHVQEAVRACVRSKHLDGRVNVLVAASPDLAIVRGAAHYVTLEAPPGGGPAQQYPQAPRYNSIISPTSYGILVAEALGGGGDLFDTFFLQGKDYAVNHVEQRNYEVKSGEPFILSVSSCNSAQVVTGKNRLDTIRGTGALHNKKFSVSSPNPTMGVLGRCFSALPCCARKPADSGPARDDTASIVVEFTLNGIELHIRVKSAKGQVLLQQAVPFVGQ